MARQKIRQIKWNNKAIISFKKALWWIGDHSIQQAEVVEEILLSCISKIALHPEIYPPDKYKKTNSGSYRAFETHSYRVSWYDDDEIRILRIRHVRQKPLEY